MASRRCADSPQIACHAAEAEVGDRNVCVRCDIRAKPAASTVFWVVTDNGSSVLAGQVTDDYWVVIKVTCVTCVQYLAFTGCASQSRSNTRSLY